MATKTIRVDYLARVEGEGALDLDIRDGRVASARLNIFEPPRFFEAFLPGRSYAELPDIVARICGICPIAYQMSAVHATEDAFGAKVDGQLRALRRLIYCGEWIESHGLHVVMLHAPDFLGFPDAIRMSHDHGDAVRNGLALKKAGNELMRLIGGREVHPVNVKPGGFYRVPTRAEMADAAESLKRARDLAVGLVRWVATFPFPDYQRDYEFVALRHPDEYPFNEGRLVSNRDIDIDIADYESEFEERHVAHSTALHSVVKRRGAYLVGPLARYALNYDKLPASVQGLARRRGLDACATIRSRASSCGRWKSPMPARKRCALSKTTSRRTPPRCRSNRARASASAAPRRHAASAGIVMSSMRRARSVKRASCRQPRRTSRASKRIWPGSPLWFWTSRTTSSATAASRAFAITIRASRVRRISSS